MTSLVKSDNFPSQNTVNTVSEMFQWRTADPVTQLSPNRNEEMDENRRQSRYLKDIVLVPAFMFISNLFLVSVLRFLISSDCEGDSNFMSLFDGKDVFL